MDENTSNIPGMDQGRGGPAQNNAACQNNAPPQASGAAQNVMPQAGIPQQGPPQGASTAQGMSGYNILNSNQGQNSAPGINQGVNNQQWYNGGISTNQPMNNELLNTTAYRGSMQSILAQNVGQRVIVDFLIGTTNMVRKEGILYAVGVSYLTLYNPRDETYVVCDLYAIQFVTFLNDTSRRASSSKSSFKLV